MSDTITRVKRVNIKIIVWLTRIAGAVFVVGGLAFFVTALVERSWVPVAMGLVTIIFGAVVVSINAPTADTVEYRLLRLRRKSQVRIS
jgi:hypothetical protein